MNEDIRGMRNVGVIEGDGLQNAIRHKPSVHESMENVDKAIESLWERVTFLQDRLQPVVSPSVPHEAVQVEGEADGGLLVNRLNGHRRSIYRVESVVNDILDRLEL